MTTAEMTEETPLKGVSLDRMPGGRRSSSGRQRPPQKPLWRVRVRLRGKEHTLGRYESLSEANEALRAFQDPIVECDPQGRCQGCQGWHWRSAWLWWTLSGSVLSD